MNEIQRLHHQFTQAGSIRYVKAPVQLRAAQVSVDQDHFQFALGKYNCQVGADGRFAILRGSARDDYAPQWRIYTGIFYVGAQGAECLRHRRTRLVGGNRAIFF